MKRVLVCGLGAIGHSIVATLNCEQIDVLISKEVEMEEIYSKQLNLGNKINNVYTYQSIEKIDHDMLIITLPYRFKISAMEKIVKMISANTTIVIVPANQGILSYLPVEIHQHPLVLFERVPHISRVGEYGKTVNIYGTKEDMHMSFLNDAKIEKIKDAFPLLNELIIHNNSLDISLITSNAVIHSARIYELFKLNNNYDNDLLFYREWTNQASEIFIKLEEEVLNLIIEIENQKNIKIDYYDMLTHFGVDVKSPNNELLTYNIQNDEAFKPIRFYVENQKQLAENRYVVDDMVIGIRFYLTLAEKYKVKMPVFEELHSWACNLVKINQPDIYNEVNNYQPDVTNF